MQIFKEGLRAIGEKEENVCGRRKGDKSEAAVSEENEQGEKRTCNKMY